MFGSSVLAGMCSMCVYIPRRALLQDGVSLSETTWQVLLLCHPGVEFHMRSWLSHLLGDRIFQVILTNISCLDGTIHRQFMI